MVKGLGAEDLSGMDVLWFDSKHEGGMDTGVATTDNCP